MNDIASNDTICAPATIPGTGAITVIRMSGKDTIAIAAKVISCHNPDLSETAGYRIRYGTVREDDGSILDNVLVSVFKAPHSYTGEDSVEISCHASPYIASELLRLLIKSGARMAGPGEFTMRAFINGKMDLTQAEAVADVIKASGAATLKIAMNQFRGGVSSELGKLRDKLLKMTSLLELELDFSEEDVEFAGREELLELVDDTLSHISKLTATFSMGNAIRNGIPVVIVGTANTGKSTLLNAILGDDRSIVSDVAGTTRDTVEEVFNVGGIAFRFIDTAGIRNTDETVERIGIERTFRKMHEASVILGVTDITRSMDTIMEEVALITGKAGKGKHLIILMNKCDMVSVDVIDGAISLLRRNFSHDHDYWNNATAGEKTGRKSDVPEIFPISAKTGFGLECLTKTLEDTAKQLTGSIDGTMITNIRHYEALGNAAKALTRVKEALRKTADENTAESSWTIPPEFIAQDLREALHHLGSIIGDITTDEILGNIFKNFCVGK